MLTTGAQKKMWAISSAGEPASAPARQRGDATTLTQSDLSKILKFTTGSHLSGFVSPKITNVGYAAQTQGL
jgi:hypothetical protein